MSHSTNQSESTLTPTITNNESSSRSNFDFDAWINDKSFISIKDAFISNKMTTIDTLNCNSTNFGGLMQSICSKNPQMIDKVIKALQSLQIETIQTTKKDINHSQLSYVHNF